MVQKVTAYKAKYFRIDCKMNDFIDMKAGGPYTLGFDFLVDVDEDTDEMIGWLRRTLTKYNHPILAIMAEDEDVQIVERLWTKDQMEKEIRTTTF